MILGVDCDGVICKFNPAYIELLRELSGTYIPPESSTFPDVWFYDHRPGITAEHRSAAWKYICSDSHFWFNLQPYPEATNFLKWLGLRSQDDVYFITNRVGNRAKFQTELWLSKHGYGQKPTVLLSADKGHLCDALSIDYYIDDCQDYIYHVLDHSPETNLFMLERPYNKPVRRVSRGSLRDFMAFVEGKNG